jgi:integrase
VAVGDEGAHAPRLGERQHGPKGGGRVFKTRYIKTAYNNAVEAAQLDDVTFHTLRHTFASWAVMRGSR